MNFTVNELFTLRVAVSHRPISNETIALSDKIDKELDKLGYKVEWVALPKVKYQRQRQGEYKLLAK